MTMAQGRAGDVAQRVAQDASSAMLRTVASNPEPELASLPAESMEVTEPKVVLRTLRDIAELCGEKRDAKLRALVRNYVGLVRMEQGRLEIALSPDAPKSMVGDLSRRLEEWTGIRWMVILSREPGDMTLAASEAKERDDRVTDARADPDVAAILARFPGARITDVRVTASDTDEPAPIAESAEGDILPADDIE
jgi:DNA polymerase-3 subunit gamma/tau